jgi:hypothetical protein
MELRTFAEFQKLLAEVQARKDFATGEIARLNREMADRQAEFDGALLEGADPEELQAELDALQRKIDLKTREWHALDLAVSGKAKTGKVHEAARAVWNEGVEIITKDLRAEWDAEVIELNKAKGLFLAAVSALGEIKDRADVVSSKLSWGLGDFLPGAGVPNLATGIYTEKHIGVIFPDYDEIKKAFKRGA